MGPMLTLFWTPCDVSSGFLSQSAALFALNRGIHVAHSLKFTSCVTPADLLAASKAAETISSTYLQAGIGGAQCTSSCARQRYLMVPTLSCRSGIGSGTCIYLFQSGE